MISVSFSDIDSFIEQKYQLFGNKHDFLSKKIILANMALKIIQVTLALFKNLHKLKASFIGVIIYNIVARAKKALAVRQNQFCTQYVQNFGKTNMRLIS